MAKSSAQTILVIDDDMSVQKKPEAVRQHFCRFEVDLLFTVHCAPAAMAAGVTNRLWDVSDIVELLQRSERKAA